jgi:F-type H+-transporting ATPase subunit epsilon
MDILSLSVDLVAPGKPVLSNFDAKSVFIATQMGYVEILPEHAPYIAEIGTGTLLIKGMSQEQRKVFFVSGGYLRVMGNKVTVMPDVVLEPDQVDLAKARQDEEMLKTKLSSVGEEQEVSRLLMAIKDAEARIEFVRQMKPGHE